MAETIKANHQWIKCVSSQKSAGGASSAAATTFSDLN
jgi:hypothetical protein